MSEGGSGNPIIDLLDMLDPIVIEILSWIPFPVNAIVAFLWGGIVEALAVIF